MTQKKECDKYDKCIHHGMPLLADGSVCDCKCHSTPTDSWRENIHFFIQPLFPMGIPSAVVNAIDAAYVAGLDANPNKLTAKEIYQNGFNAGKEKNV